MPPRAPSAPDPGRSEAGAGAAAAWIDGGARGNPGPAGCGVVLDLGDGNREEHSLFIGTGTNNVAEYAALLAALARAAELDVRTLVVHSDSELLVRQMTGVYRVKAPHLRALWLRAGQLARRLGACTFRHVRREQNREADRLANLAMDTGRSTLPLPEGL